MRKLNLQDPATDLRDLTQEIDTNLAGPIRMAAVCWARNWGSKPPPSSTSALGWPGLGGPVSPVYGATKAGLRSYTQSLRVQLHATNVQVFKLGAPSSNTSLFDQSHPDMAGSSIKESDSMAPGKVVAQVLPSMQRNAQEVSPGMATAIRHLSRLAPGFMVKQLSKGMSEALPQPEATAPSKE